MIKKLNFKQEISLNKHSLKSYELYNHELLIAFTTFVVFSFITSLDL